MVQRVSGLMNMWMLLEGGTSKGVMEAPHAFLDIFPFASPILLFIGCILF